MAFSKTPPLPDAPRQEPMGSVSAVIISIGTELSTGQTMDTNAVWLAGRLTDLGAQVRRHLTVADDPAELCAVIAESVASGGVVILTGGLGPTQDDVTRQALGSALARPLEEDAEALDQIRGFFAARRRTMHETNRMQALRPRGCSIIPNPWGTAPGIRHQNRDVFLAALPGVPAEMKAMFDRFVAPEVSARTGCQADGTQYARLHVYGVTEARVGATLAGLMKPGRNPSVGTTASQTVITVRIVARAADADAAQRLLNADRTAILSRLGRAVFGEGDETLQAAVARHLTSTGATVATAESCTGGLLAKYLTDIPGSSAYFRQGYVTYADEAKSELLGIPAETIALHGAVSEPVASELAVRCRQAARADFGLSTTGIAGPAGGSPPEKPVGLVYVGLAHSAGVDVHRLLLGETLARDEIRDRTCKAALNALRLKILESRAASE
jgi:nicotinamide-nucleotide amidase